MWIARRVVRLVVGGEAKEPASVGLQQPFPYPAVDPGAALGLARAGTHGASAAGGLATDQRSERHLRSLFRQLRDPLLFREHGTRVRCLGHVSLQR